MDTVTHTVNLFKGILKPKEEFAKYREADNVNGIGWRIVVLSVISGLLGYALAYVASDVLGITSSLQQSFQSAGLQMSEETISTFTSVIGAITGFVTPIISMLFDALIALIFFSEVGYKKLFSIELYLAVISVIGSAVTLILMTIFKSSLPFLSVGIITRLFTDQAFLNAFFGGITLFLIWQFYVRFVAYRNASSKSMTYIIWVLVILYVILLLLTSVNAGNDPSPTLPV